MPVLYLVESSGSVADMSFNVDGIQFLTIVPERKGTRKGNHFFEHISTDIECYEHNISDKERRTTDKKIWLSLHTRKSDSHVTERLPPDSPQQGKQYEFSS